GFAAGTTGNIRVTDAIAETSGVSMADGVKLVFVAPSSVPAAPTGLAATAIGTSRIALSWTDNATNETAYFVARSSLSGGPYTNIATLPANSTSYTNSGLAAGAIEYYVVRATDYLGASPNSIQASATRWTAPMITLQPLE